MFYQVVILGTGWVAHALLRDIDGNKFDVTTVSPRNFFLFTPMLAASAGEEERAGGDCLPAVKSCQGAA